MRKKEVEKKKLNVTTDNAKNCFSVLSFELPSVSFFFTFSRFLFEAINCFIFIFFFFVRWWGNRDSQASYVIFSSSCSLCSQIPHTKYGKPKKKKKITQKITGLRSTLRPTPFVSLRYFSFNENSISTFAPLICLIYS